MISRSVLSDSLINSMDWTIALSVGFPRQEEWSGLPFPPLRDLLDPGIESKPPALTGGFFLPLSPLGSPEEIRGTYTVP